MHKGSLLRMQWFVDTYVSKISKNEIKVLDVGSYDVNGSYRSLFAGEKYRYTGLDMEAGPNVDVVLEHPYDWSSIATDQYDVVVSGQAFEHVEFFWLTMAEMARALKRDGLLCLIAPNGFGEHRHPVDCYRFHTDGMVALARYCQLEILHAHTNCAPSRKDDDWYSEQAADALLIARKPYDGEVRHPELRAYKCIPASHEALRGSLVTYQKKQGLRRLWHRVKQRMDRPPAR